MKKILFSIAVAAFTFAASVVPVADVKAQTVKLTTKTITAADTVTFSSVGSKVKAFQYTYTETSGTTAGKVYLEGNINGTWVALDSLTLADVATAQTKVTVLTATSYLNYRFRNTNTSSATGAIRAAYIRRTDE